MTKPLFKEHYRDYIITFELKPIPSRAFDFDYAHKDYDGPEDRRCGNAESVAAAQRDIDEIIEEGRCPNGIAFARLRRDRRPDYLCAEHGALVGREVELIRIIPGEEHKGSCAWN